jgi:hypothetical protein
MTILLVAKGEDIINTDRHAVGGRTHTLCYHLQMICLPTMWQWQTISETLWQSGGESLVSFYGFVGENNDLHADDLQNVCM